MKELCLVLGVTGSRRTEIAQDIASYGWPEGQAVRVFTHGLTTDETHWSNASGKVSLPQPGEERAAVLVTDGRHSQIDQLEALIAAAPGADWEIKRIVTVIDLPLLHRRDVLSDWYQACLHFSDAAVLVGRSDVPNAWLSKFLEKQQSESVPCLIFTLPKRGGLPNPAQIIEGDARRMSHVLDDLDAVDEMEFDEDNLPEEPFDLVRKVDRYFERDMHGRRVLGLADIVQVLREEGR